MVSSPFKASFDRIKRNVGLAFFSSVAAGVLGLLTIAVNARALSLHDLGNLVIVQSLAMLINGLGSFGSHLAVIRSGLVAAEQGNAADLYGIVRFARLLDLFAGIFAALLALLVAGPAGEAFALSATVRTGMAYFAGALLVSSLYSGLGILRLMNRFGVISTVEVASAIALFLAAVILWLLDAPLTAYFAVYALVFGGAPLARYVIGLRILRAEYSAPAGRHRLSRKDSRDFLRFAAGSSVWSSLELLRSQADTLIAGYLFTPAAVGIFGVAKQIAGAARRFSELASGASFAEIGRLEARGELRESRALVTRICALSALVGGVAIVGAAIFGKPLLHYGFGPQFVTAYAALVILTVGAALQFVASPIVMYVQILKGAGIPLLATALGLIVFAVVAFLLAPGFGIAGIAWANPAFFLVIIAIGAIVIRSSRLLNTSSAVPGETS